MDFHYTFLLIVGVYKVMSIKKNVLLVDGPGDMPPLAYI